MHIWKHIYNALVQEGIPLWIFSSYIDTKQIHICTYIHTYKYVHVYIYKYRGFPGGWVVRNSSANAGDAGDVGLIPGSKTSPEEGNGNPSQYSCLENPMDREAWRATGPQVVKSQTWLNNHTHSPICTYINIYTHTHTYIYVYIFI